MSGAEKVQGVQKARNGNHKCQLSGQIIDCDCLISDEDLMAMDLP